MNTKEIHDIKNKLMPSHSLANYLLDTPPEQREEEDIILFAKMSADGINELLETMERKKESKMVFKANDVNPIVDGKIEVTERSTGNKMTLTIKSMNRDTTLFTDENGAEWKLLDNNVLELVT